MAEALIPGLPDEIAELCLLRLPYPYQFIERSVSQSWNRALSDPFFLKTKQTLFPFDHSRPLLFVLAFHQQHGSLQWQALDPSSGFWFVLPAMPLSDGGAFPVATTNCWTEEGKLFVNMCGHGATGMHHEYDTGTNKWSPPTLSGGGGTEKSWRLWRDGRKWCPRDRTVTAAGREFVISDNGDWKVKVNNTWQHVGGDRFPREKLPGPYGVAELEEKIYVVSRGLNTAIGSVVVDCQEEEEESVKARWEVVEAPQRFCDFIPYICLSLMMKTDYSFIYWFGTAAGASTIDYKLLQK